MVNVHKKLNTIARPIWSPAYLVISSAWFMSAWSPRFPQSPNLTYAYLATYAWSAVFAQSPICGYNAWFFTLYAWYPMPSQSLGLLCLSGLICLVLISCAYLVSYVHIVNQVYGLLWFLWLPGPLGSCVCICPALLYVPMIPCLAMPAWSSPCMVHVFLVSQVTLVS